MSSGIIKLDRFISSTRRPQCLRCVHYLGRQNRQDRQRCNAFPEKNIPREYFFGKVKHELVLGNQIGNYVYEGEERFKEEDEHYDSIGKKAIAELATNKANLPIIIREQLKREGADLDSIEKLEIKSFGPLRNRFSFQIEFFPKEKKVAMDCSKMEGIRIVFKIIQALEAKNLAPRFNLTIFKDGDYKYE